MSKSYNDLILSKEELSSFSRENREKYEDLLEELQYGIPIEKEFLKQRFDKNTGSLKEKLEPLQYEKYYFQTR